MKKNSTVLLLFLSAMLALNAQTYLSENFDGENPTDGWAIFDNGTGTTRSWQLYDIGFSQPKAAAVQYENVSSGVAEDYFATPIIDLSSSTSPRLSFMAKDSYSGTDYGSTYSVLVSTTEQNSIESYTEVASWTETELGSEWNMKIVDLAAYAGQQVYIAFKMANDDGDNFIIDNVVVDENLENNVTLLSLGLTKYMVANQDSPLKYEVRNSGSNTVTTLELNWNDGTDHIATVDVNIPSGDVVEVAHPTLMNYSNIAQYDITATISKVNGVDDAHPSDNSLTSSVNTISQDGGKKVLFEEGTGTWCGYCPRGAVMMDEMYQNHPETFIGIAIHNSDPMTVTEYDSSAGFQGFPSLNVDRAELGAGVDVGNYPVALMNSRMAPTPVSLNAESSLSGRELTIDASATFYSNFNNANFKLGVIIVENEVTGTASGYSQANYYAGGSNGAMGGYENLPNPVPAADMVYNHVGRALLGGYNGQDGSIPSSLTDGESAGYTFNYTVPEEYDLSHLHAVVVLIDGSNGQIVNANSFNLGSLSVKDVNLNNSFSLYPNPAKENVNISISESGNYKATIYNLAGQKVSSLNLNDLNSNEKATIPVNNLKPGVYILTLATKGKSFSKKLIIK